MTALVGTILLGFATLAIDLTVWEGNVSRMQGAADQVAHAAGFAMINGNAVAQSEAKGLAAAYGYVDGVNNVNVTVNIPPLSGSHTAVSNAVEVIISQKQTNYLSNVLTRASVNSLSRSVTVPGAGNTCIMALAPSGKGIDVSGSGNINASTCNIYVNSNAACDVTLSATAYIQAYDIYLGEASQSGCAGGSSYMTASDQLTLSSHSAIDPYSSRSIPVPAGACTKPADETTDFLPDTYCTLNFQTDATLEPGLYIVDSGGLTVQGGVTVHGTNVSIVLTTSSNKYGKVVISGGGVLSLTSMTSGPTHGIGVWVDPNGGQDVNVTGGSMLDVTGAVYAPASKATWSGGSTTSTCMQLIANTITISGPSNFQHNCSGVGVSDVGSAAGYTLAE